jgi:hypothetical protein
MLEAYFTMDFGVIDCNYEIFSICPTDTGEKLRKVFERTANYLHTLKRQQYSKITLNYLIFNMYKLTIKWVSN